METVALAASGMYSALEELRMRTDVVITDLSRKCTL